MSSNPSPLPNTGPCGKIRHKSKAQALGHIRSLKQRRLPNADSLQPFRCGHCGRWHVGHAQPLVRRPSCSAS